MNVADTLQILMLTKTDDIHVIKISSDLKLIVSFSSFKKIEIINPSGRMWVWLSDTVTSIESKDS